MKTITPIACQHIADYYEQRWLGQRCLAFKLLRKGYAQCAIGLIERGFNNLYGTKRDFA